MVMSFKESLEKKEIKPNIKVKLNEYKKSLKNNILLSEWIKECLFNQDFINFNLEKLSLKEIALFNKNINKSKTDFLIECRNFYKEDFVPEFFKIYTDNNCLDDFFENYSIILYNKTLKNANCTKLLISEMLIESRDLNNFEISCSEHNSFLPVNNFKVKNENLNFELEIDEKNKKINLKNCNQEKFNIYFENRNKDKSLVNLYIKPDNIKNFDDIKKNMMFLKSTYLENEKLNIKPSKNCIQVKCKKNEIAFDDKNAFPIFKEQFQIFDFLRK